MMLVVLLVAVMFRQTGIDKFNENAKGGKLEGKGKEIQKIAEKNKVPVNIFMAIIASESQWGKGENATRQNNPLSVMGSNSFMIQHIQLLKMVLMRELKICMMFIFLKV